MSSRAQDAGPLTPSSAAQNALAALIVAIATLAAYHNCLRGAFVFDDQSSIVENTSIRSLWPLSQLLNPPPDAGICGRPFANLTVALNYAFGRLDIRGYRATNLAIHAMAALALFGVVRRTLQLPKLRERFGRDATPLATAAAVLWALHPLTTIVVNYISQRVEGLMALFYLLTLYAFIRSTNESARRWPALAVVACLLGMASKEVMVTAPVMIFLYDRTFIAGSFRGALRLRWQLHLALALTWLPLAWFMANAQLAHRGIGLGLGVSSFDYALNECRAVLLYLKLALWPHPLVFDYGWDFLSVAPDAVPYVLGISVLALATLLALWRRPAVGFFGAWFFVVLAPSSSVVPLIQQPLAESRVYLSLAAVAAFAATGAYLLAGRRGLWACALVAVGLGLATARRNTDYHNEIALWSDTVAKRPENARAHCNLGAALLRGGRMAEARSHFESALRFQPNYPDAHKNLGDILLQSGDLAQAIAEYENAVAKNPAFADAYCNLGEALSITGDTDRAIGALETAVRLKPEHTRAHNNLGVVLLQLGRVTEAISHDETAVRLDPAFAEAHYNLGNALARNEQMTDAIAQFETAVRLERNFAKAHNNLGASLLRAGRVTEAVPHFEAALKLRPDYAEARKNLNYARSLMQP